MMVIIIIRLCLIGNFPCMFACLELNTKLNIHDIVQCHGAQEHCLDHETINYIS